jgi:hypothetical protein
VLNALLGLSNKPLVKKSSKNLCCFFVMKWHVVLEGEEGSTNNLMRYLMYCFNVRFNTYKYIDNSIKEWSETKGV